MNGIKLENLGKIRGGFLAWEKIGENLSVASYRWQLLCYWFNLEKAFSTSLPVRQIQIDNQLWSHLQNFSDILL